MGYDYDILLGIIDFFKNKRILCIGDIMLDRYVYGDVERISPEAPIPILEVTKEDSMLGGAGNVARNIAAFNAEVDFYCVVGDDRAGYEIKRLLEKESNITPFITTSSSTNTSVKTRYVSGQQQLLRVDFEDNSGTSCIMHPEYVADYDAVVISDYDKGALCDQIIGNVIKTANECHIPVVVDSKSGLFSFKGATVWTPNIAELARIADHYGNMLDDENIKDAAHYIIQQYGIKNVLVTRSAKGMTLQTYDNKTHHIPATAKEIFDVVGAGDTVAAVMALGLASKLALRESAFLANMAAGIVVGKHGTSICTPGELKAILVSLILP